MPDFKVAALIETNAGQVAREVRGSADAIDQVGASAMRASKGTDELAVASRRLADAQHAAAVADAAVAKMQDRTDASRPKIIANMREYSRAIEEQRASRIRLAQATKAAQDVQEKAEAAEARSASRGGSGGGGTSARTIATGVGIGVAAEKAIELVTEKAKEFFTGSVEQASALQETLGTSVEIFGAYAQQVDKFGKGSANALGLSRQAAIETTDTFGSLFHAVGVEGDKALSASTGLTKLGVDLAAFKREADPGFAFHALQQALSGQYDALHNYDIILTSATVRQEAYRLGLIRTRTDALTPQATALAAASLATQQAHTQTGAFARSSDELAGKQKILSANIKDAQAQLGQGLLPVMAGAADVAEGTLVPALKGIGTAIEFIGEHDVTRHIAEIALAMYGLSVAVNITAGAYARLAGSATVAAGAETAAGRAGGLGNLGIAGRGGIAAVGLGSLTIIGAGIVAAVQEVLNRRGLDHSIKQQADEAKAQGPAARTKQAADFGVRPGNNPGEFIVDPKGDPDKRAAGIDLLTGLPTSTPSGTTPVGAALARAQALTERARARQSSAAFNVRDARAYLDSRSYLKDAGSMPLGGLFDALPEKPDASVVQNARDEQKAAAAALAIAQARVKDARATTGGASRGQIAAAEAAVISARNATQRRGGDPEAEALRLEAAEARLAKLRQGGKTDTTALMTAEKGLEDARTRQRRASEALHKAEKEASGDKSLTLQEVLTRASHTAKTSTAEVANVRSLVKAGVTQPVIDELERLEQTAPGTIAKVAKGLTPAFVKQLNADQKARDDAAIQLAELGGQAKLKAAQAEAGKSGKALGDAITAGILAALRDPSWQAAADSELGKLLTPGGTADPPGAKQPGGATGGQPSGLDSFGRQQAGLPPGVATGVTVAPSPVTPHGPAPVVVAPRQTTHHNTFPNVKTTAQARAELEHLELIDSLR